MTDPATNSGYGSSLFPQHQQKLASSAVSAEVAAQRGYVSADTKAQLQRFGFPPSQQLPPGLVIPIHGVTGEVVGHQLRPDSPRMLKGKPVKYETVCGQRMALDVPPCVRKWLGDPTVPLIVTEGPLKADAAASAGLACIALMGVYGWRGRNEDDGSVALADWECVDMKGRRVVIAFDSDVMLKEAVYGAFRRLGAFLGLRGADVAYAYLPPGTNGQKVGLDDWLAAGNAAADFWNLCTTELRPLAGAVPVKQVEDYSDVPVEAGAGLFDDIARFVSRYVILPGERYLIAVTLWVVHTWLAEHADSTPRLAVLSPEKASGKTRLMEVIELLVYAPLRVSSTTSAALFRSLGKGPRTLLIDEIDTVFGGYGSQNEDLRAFLNAGHRKGASITRCTGDGAKMDVMEFPSFAPAAMAGIGTLPDTILDRSVIVPMQRRRPDEQVTSFRYRLAREEAAPLARRIGAWAARAGAQVEQIIPAMPIGLSDRPADVWEPLIALADAAGGTWPQQARTAAV